MGNDSGFLAGAADSGASAASLPPAQEVPPLIAAELQPDQRAAGSRLTQEERRLHYARWFISMRWIAVGVAGCLVAGTVFVAELLPARVALPLLALIGLLALLNYLYLRHLRAGAASKRFLALQAYADLGVLVMLLHFSGGIENPLAPLMLLHVIIAGVVLGRREAYQVAIAAGALYTALAVGEWSGLLPHYTLGVFPHGHGGGPEVHASHDALWVGSMVSLNVAIFMLVAYFSGTLAERIRKDERQIEIFAARAQAQMQLLERALDTTETALCLCDRQQHPFWCNSRWIDWLEQAPGLSCRSRSAADPDSFAFSADDQRIRVSELEVEAPATGSPRVFQLTTAPLLDRDGHVSHVVTLARDVTVQRKAHGRMVRAERLAAVGELAGQVAHEVNNPIAIISAKARLLLRPGHEPLPPKAEREITKIVELCDRVARIAQGLLSYTRPVPGAREPLDIRVPIRRAVAFVEARAAESGVRIEDELREPPFAVLANAAELEQVFLNLLLNSLDAMPAGGKLRIAFSQESDCLAVVVEDTGTGVPPELQTRIFDPFLTTKPEGQGSGLGLSICLGLVRSHGGGIEIESEPDQFTRVTVRLPPAPQQVPAPAGDTSAATEEGHIV